MVVGNGTLITLKHPVPVIAQDKVTAPDELLSCILNINLSPFNGVPVGILIVKVLAVLNACHTYMSYKLMSGVTLVAVFEPTKTLGSILVFDTAFDASRLTDLLAG